MNAGLGFRTRLNDEWALGANVFFDRFRTENGNDFSRGSIGVEALSETWEARANAYIAENGNKLAPDLSVFDPLTAMILPGEESAFSGIDFEVGYRLNLIDDPVGRLRLVAGSYAFGAEGYQTMAGPKGGVELTLHEPFDLPRGSQIAFEANAQWDDPRGFNAGAMVSFRMPLQALFGQPEGHGYFEGLEQRMNDRVEREDAGWAGTRLGGPVVATINGEVITDVIFLNEGGIGLADGTSPENAADFDTYYAGMAQYGGAPVVGALHVVLGDQGVINSIGASLVFGQILLGGGGSIMISGDGGSVNYSAPGSRPTLANEGGTTDAVLTLADNVTIKSINFDVFQAYDGMNSGSYRAIFGSDVANILLDDLYIEGVVNLAGGIINDDQFGREGIFIQRSQNLTISNVTLRNTWGEGIDLRAIQSARLSNITIDGTGRAGLLYSDDDGVTIDAIADEDIVIDGFSVNNTGAFGVGVYFGDNVILRNGVVTDAGRYDLTLGHGIFIVGSDRVVAENIVNRDMLASGFLVGDFLGTQSTNIVIRNSEVENAVYGVWVINSSVAVSDTAIRGIDIDGAGIRFSDSDNTVASINNVTIEDGPRGYLFTGTGSLTMSGAGNTSAAILLCDEDNEALNIVGGIEVNGVANAVDDANCS